MQIIPVIDLKAGQVVHAIADDRERYQAINTPLCQSSNTVDVIHAFLNLYSFKQFYIADLDALTGTGNHRQLINKLVSNHPQLSFIVDAGYDTDFFSRQYPPNYLPIQASESLRPEHLVDIKPEHQQVYLLSLDYQQGKNLGPEALFSNADLWPKDLIIMSLNRVGKSLGPDFDRLASIRKANPNHNLLAAGGIRHIADVMQLKKQGIYGALVASALHSGAISRSDLEKIFVEQTQLD